MLGTAYDEATPLLGRLEEQNLLTLLLDDVPTRGHALVLHGEPGIGKSRLLSETQRTARARGMAVLTTAGVQSEAHLPFADCISCSDRCATVRASSVTSSAPHSTPLSA